jgi:drug/metabolite transporter (DMT)-like permease
MQVAVLLAVAASLCTAAASLAQRQGAKSVQTTGGFDARLMLNLARRPVWLLGIVSMIGGFGFQLTALRYGPLAMVQPILSLELLLVFGFLAFAGRRRVRIKPRDWLGAAAMCAGIALFLRLASPSGGRLHAAASSWMLAGMVTLGLVLVALAVAFGLGNRPGAASSRRRAGVLGSATGIAWGFVAAVIKELSSHLGGGLGAIFSTWSLYVLVVVGAATMLLASHALAAGPLAASQPGFTILDPLAASLLGVFLFREHIQTGPWDLVGEALALGLVAAGAAVLSRSCFIRGEMGDPSCLPVKSRRSLALAAQQGGQAGEDRQGRRHAEHDDEAAVERAGQQGREERPAGQRGLACGGQLRQDAARRQEVLDRVDAEDGGEERRDRRQRGHLAGDAAGHAELDQAARERARQRA